jgi:hypothetical protein
MTIKKTPPGPPPRVNVRRILEAVATLVVGHIRERCEDGRDIADSLFLPYSDNYAETRAALGRNSAIPDMLMTGGLLGAVQVVERTDDSVTIGVGTGTSRTVRAPTKRNRRKRAGERRGPPHNLLGKWHQEGAGHNKKRRWFGVSPRGDKEIRKDLNRQKPPLLQSGSA